MKSVELNSVGGHLGMKNLSQDDAEDNSTHMCNESALPAKEDVLQYSESLSKRMMLP